MNDYLKVLSHVKNRPQTFQSDFVRNHASLVAEAASRGHISCLNNGRNSGRWNLTLIGHSFLTMAGGAL